MARIVRTKQKIFAENAPTNQVTTFGSIKDGAPVYTKTPADIMNSNFETGWSSAVEDDYAPYRQDRNAIDTVFSQQLAYIFQEGTPEWESNTTYYIGSIVKLIDGNNVKIYRSIADNNTSVLTDTTKWVLFLIVDNTGAVTITAKVPNQPAGDNSTNAANTAFVQNALGSLNGAISTVLSYNLTASKAVVSNASGKIVSSNVTSTELSYLSGVTSPIQTQINSIFSSIYPVGSIYIGTQSTCPMTSLITGSTWVLVASDKALWTGNGSNGNTTKAAGLPNITGKLDVRGDSGSSAGSQSVVNGAFRKHNQSTKLLENSYADGGVYFDFDASRSSSIYGNSTTVQPPAYVVNVWRRTA